jgi:hypothetical protein
MAQQTFGEISNANADEIYDSTADVWQFAPLLVTTASATALVVEDSSNQDVFVVDTNTPLVTIGSGVATNLAVVGAVYCNDAAGPSLLNEAATQTNPTVLPNRAEPDTGIGWAGADQLSGIVGGTETWRATPTGFQTVGSASYGSASGTFLLLNTPASNTVPTICPDGAGPATGLGGDANTSLSGIVNSTEIWRADLDATAGNTRFMLYDVDSDTLKRVSVGAADSGGAGYKVLRIPN